MFRNGARYLGDWRCNLKHGIGTFYYPDGSRYEGEWKHNLKHGHGVYTFTNGDRYDGSWYKDKRHGVGKYIFDNGQCTFNGTWRNGETNGPAEHIYKSHRFHGTWNKNAAIGPGVYSFGAKTMAVGYMAVVHDTQCIGKKKDEATVKSESETSIDDSKAKLCDAEWKMQNIMAYEYGKLPPHPVPLALVDSDEEDVTPRIAEDELIEFEVNEEEAELDGENCVEDFVLEAIEEEEDEAKEESVNSELMN